ncbi:MAG: PEP-CTERM sorting domain-containing protein [Gammaproteobacteria bacterium]|nr:PEP-CTERM sorting domain-containing protein [Gammaproteobacteria bacterium]
MRLTKTLSAIFIASTIATGTAMAAPSATSAFFPGQVNFASDDYAEYLINLNPMPLTPTNLDPGDLLIGLLRFNTVEGVSTGGTNVIGACCDEFTAVFAQKYLGRAGVNLPPLPLPLGLFGSDVFGAITPADIVAATGSGQMSATLAAYLGSWAPGTIIATYSDAANDWSRIAAGDVDPGNAEEEALLDTAGPVSVAGSNVPLFEVGFAGLPGEFFTASLPSTDLALLGAIPPGTGAAAINAAVNITSNSTGIGFSPVECLIAGSGIMADFCVGGNITGVGGAATPYDLFGNIEARFFVIPEPTTTPLVLLGGTMIGLGLAARRRREA